MRPAICRLSFIVPLIAYAYVAFYGFYGYRAGRRGNVTGSIDHA